MSSAACPQRDGIDSRASFLKLVYLGLVSSIQFGRWRVLWKSHETVRIVLSSRVSLARHQSQPRLARRKRGGGACSRASRLRCSAPPCHGAASFSSTSTPNASSEPRWARIFRNRAREPRPAKARACFERRNQTIGPLFKKKHMSTLCAAQGRGEAHGARRRGSELRVVYTHTFPSLSSPSARASASVSATHQNSTDGTLRLRAWKRAP